MLECDFCRVSRGKQRSTIGGCLSIYVYDSEVVFARCKFSVIGLHIRIYPDANNLSYLS